jgi:hypothetical protein
VAIDEDVVHKTRITARRDAIEALCHRLVFTVVRSSQLATAIGSNRTNRPTFTKCDVLIRGDERVAR